MSPPDLDPSFSALVPDRVARHLAKTFVESIPQRVEVVVYGVAVQPRDLDCVVRGGYAPSPEHAAAEVPASFPECLACDLRTEFVVELRSEVVVVVVPACAFEPFVFGRSEWVAFASGAHPVAVRQYPHSVGSDVLTEALVELSRQCCRGRSGCMGVHPSELFARDHDLARVELADFERCAFDFD